MSSPKKECEHHIYKVGGPQASLILCDMCGRVKVIKNKDGQWENLY